MRRPWPPRRPSSLMARRTGWCLARGLAAALLVLLAGLGGARAQGSAAPPDDEQDCYIGRPVSRGICFLGLAAVDGVWNMAGGIRQGVEAIGLGTLGVNADLGTLWGATGWSFQATSYWIIGRQMSISLVGSQSQVSSNEAASTVRLAEFWVQRELGGFGSIRIGQIEPDTEFTISHGASWLVNGAFGYPVAISNAQPSGGPAYPFAAPGIRLALGDPDNGTGLRLALTSGDPVRQEVRASDPLRINRYFQGTGFSFQRGIAYFAEAVVGPAAPDDPASAGSIANPPRPWTVKFGGWYNNGGFDSVQYDENGLSLASPASNGVPRRFGQNLGAYAIVEGTVMRRPGSSLELFARGWWAPGDRNEFATQVDAGLLWRGPFGRPRDLASFGASMPIVGNPTRAYNRAQQAYGTPVPVQTYELALEASYGFEAIAPARLMVWPFAQVIVQPSALQPNAQYSATRGLPNAYVTGLRLSATF